MNAIAAILIEPKNRRKLWILYICVVVLAIATVFYRGYGRGQFSTLNLPWETALGIFAAACFCEFFDASMGMGFGTILTPVLMFFGFPPSQIVPTILVSELFTGLMTSGSLQTMGVVNLKPGSPGFLAAAVLSICSIIGTVTAVLIAVHIPRSLLSFWIAAIIIAMGLVILLRRNPIKFSLPKLFGLGLLASFNKGLSGGGYGPLLTGGQIVAGLPPKDAVAITSFAESFTCFVGLTTYLFAQKTILSTLTLPLVFGALCAIPLAVHTVKCAKSKRLRMFVGAGVLLLGLLLLKGIN